MVRPPVSLARQRASRPVTAKQAAVALLRLLWLVVCASSSQLAVGRCLRSTPAYEHTTMLVGRYCIAVESSRVES